MGSYQLGQRWISETEPELGLGLIIEIEGRTIKILFAQAQEERIYSSHSAPLKRVRFAQGDTVKLHDGHSVLILNVHDQDNLYIYENAEGELFPESLLSAEIQFSRPEDRFLNGLLDEPSLFELRLKTQEYKRQLLARPVRGLVGAKISLIPHQLYIAQRVTQMHSPRVLLADQVGLGKTIEASLIIHRLLLTNQISRVMILLPDSLVHQWFFELYRKFSLSFKMINQETVLEKGENPFKDNERVIVSMGLLKGAPLARELLAEADFDLLVVDEAHGLKSKDDEYNFEFKMVEGLAAKIPRLILLTATPEQFGQRDHFRRLQLLDPQKYHSFDHYISGKKDYSKVADAIREVESMSGEIDFSSLDLLNNYFSREELEKLSKEQIIHNLADRVGTGRSYFRNIRKSMDREFLFFPKRKLNKIPLRLGKKGKMSLPSEDHELGAAFEEKCLWFMESLNQIFAEQKILLICKSKKKILKLEEFLKKHLSSVKTASFHSDLSLMARDRQAAYFADPEGAQILLCTEVGSEGRNFEFCQNLVLFDLPLHPHPLEQRIGRLDRIGQKRDIHIYVPYIEATWEEVLIRWYHEGINLIENSTESSQEVFEVLKGRLHELLVEPRDIDSFIEETKNHVSRIEAELQQGRDLLVEKNSFDPIVGKELVREITKLDTSDDLSDYLDEVFHSFGVDVEDIQASTWYVRPGDNMFVPSFPHLDSDGKTFTFSRTKALQREDFDFLTWDHPLVQGAMDLIISQNFGTNCIVVREGGKAKGGFYLEGFYAFDCPAPESLGLERFGAGQFFRVLMDDQGKNLTEKFSKSFIDSKVTKAPKEIVEMAKKFPKEKFLALKRKMDQLALESLKAARQEVVLKVEQFYSDEISRFEKLSQYQPELAERELGAIKKHLEDSKKIVEQAGVRFDCFRCIF